ncbi:MAG TPA: AAA family ATPase [Candidatus Paceibacterota bacterium]|nr:AAA family ATPase [Candidatus Paceibacterota bacterium]
MIIGITGTLGSGKGTVVEYLVKKGFTHYSVRDFLVKEIEKRGLEKNRDTMLLVANDLRATYGPGYIAEELMQEAKKHSGNAVIESIRSLGEGAIIKAGNGVMWAVDADMPVRYQRITKRGTVTDAVSYEKFMQDEQAEYNNDDPAKNNLKKLIETADVVFLNNGTPTALFAQVEKALTNA